MGDRRYGVNWDYVMTTCRHMDDWFALKERFDFRKAFEETGIPYEARSSISFSFIEDGHVFKYKGGLSKYANDTTYVERIEVARDSIHIWISQKISHARDGYLFSKVQPQCREDFLIYIKARPFLFEKLTIKP